MKTISISGNLREITTKSDLKNLRKSGYVPCNLYGNKMENVLFSVEEKQILKITNTPNSYIVELNIDGKIYTSILQAAQYHPLTDKPLHIDFTVVSDAKPVAINVPIVIKGNSKGVREGGKLMVNSRKLRISAPLNKLPDNIEVDITAMKIGHSIFASDVVLEGVQILTPPTTIICSVILTRAAIGAAAAESAAEEAAAAEAPEAGATEESEN